MSKKDREEQEYRESCNLAAQSIVRLPGDLGCSHRISRRSASGLRRPRGSSGTRDDATDFNLYGLTNFSTANYLQTTTGGGEPGVSTGFGSATLFRLNAVTAVTAYMFQNTHSSGGWAVLGSGGFLMKTGVGSAQVISSRASVASDVGKIFLLIGRHSGASNLNQLYVDRALNNSLAQASFAAASGDATWLGNGVGAASPADNVTVLATCTFRGTPSDAQIQAYFDFARVLGDLPDTLGGATVTHLWSAKRELVGLTVNNGQIAPAQLTDRVTAAAGDALARVGSPTVKVIDPTIDGRRTLGAQGGSVANGFLAGVGKGVQGSASGFFVDLTVRFDVLAAANQMIAACFDGTNGWYVQITSANVLRCVVVSVGTSTVAGSYTLVAADLGQPLLVRVQYTGTAARLFLRGVQVGADAVGGFVQASATAMWWAGGVNNATWVFTSGAVFGLQGGNYSPTLAETQAAYAEFDRTGRLPTQANTAHSYELAADILASGVDAVPATVLDRVGTDNLTRVGIAVQTDANAIRGVGPYGAADGWQTAPGGGVQGAASGFHMVFDMWWTRLPGSADSPAAICANAGVTNGWYLHFSAGAMKWVLNSGGGFPSAAYTVTSGDLNKRVRVVFNYDQPTGKLQLWVNGAKVGTDANFAGTYVPPSAAAMVFGTYSGTSLGNGYLEALAGGNVSLSAGNVAAYSANLTQAIPTIAGVTQKKWTLESDIAAASGALPARSVERISGGDDMVRIGSPLVLAQRTERLWSYETAPILYGVDAFTDADYFSALNGFPGAAAGWWVCLPFVLESQAVASRTRVLLACETTGNVSGWQIRTTATNTLLSVAQANAAGTSTAGPSTVLSASDVGKTLLAFVCWDGAKLHLWIKRAEVGTGTTIAGYLPAAAGQSLYFGKGVAGSVSADGVRGLGAMGGNSIISFAEVCAAHDAFLASDDLMAIPGKTDLYVSVKQDAVANGGALPSTLTDRIGGKNLAKTGSPTLVPMYARIAGW